MPNELVADKPKSSIVKNGLDRRLRVKSIVKDGVASRKEREIRSLADPIRSACTKANTAVAPQYALTFSYSLLTIIKMMKDHRHKDHVCKLIRER